LPDRDGLLVLAELHERYPAISIVVLSALQDRDNVVKASIWAQSDSFLKLASAK
jgi:DNA-binding NarL/FixJ family response regulator